MRRPLFKGKKYQTATTLLADLESGIPLTQSIGNIPSHSVRKLRTNSTKLSGEVAALLLIELRMFDTLTKRGRNQGTPRGGLRRIYLRGTARFTLVKSSCSCVDCAQDFRVTGTFTPDPASHAHLVELARLAA